MNKAQQILKSNQLLDAADDLLRQVIRLNGRNRLFVEDVIDAQFALDDSRVHLDSHQTLLPRKRA